MAIAPDAPMPPEKKFWGQTTAEIQKMLIVATMGFVSTVTALFIGYWLNSKSPHLKVATSDTITYQGDSYKIGIINTSITNDGSKEAEDVSCWIPLPGCKVLDAKASPDNLNAVKSTKGDSTIFAVANLNPGETLQISIITDNPGNLPHQADVAVRSKTVKGEKAPQKPNDAPAAFVAAGIAIAVSLFFLFVSVKDLIAVRRARAKQGT